MRLTVEEKINVIAPVLRMQLGRDGRYPVVRFVEQTERAAVALSVSEPVDADGVIAAAAVLHTAADVQAVAVDGIGAFEIDPADASLAGRVAGKVLIVTGAAQGFGLEIAQSLVEQGACVVLADINDTEAQNQAQSLQKQYGPNRAMAVAMNVTDRPA